jgi:hypothetical protein
MVRTPLFDAAKDGDIKRVQSLLSTGTCNVDVGDSCTQVVLEGKKEKI